MVDQVAGAQVMDQVAAAQLVVDQVAGAQVLDQDNTWQELRCLTKTTRGRSSGA